MKRFLVVWEEGGKVVEQVISAEVQGETDFTLFFGNVSKLQTLDPRTKSPMRQQIIPVFSVSWRKLVRWSPLGESINTN